MKSRGAARIKFGIISTVSALLVGATVASAFWSSSGSGSSYSKARTAQLLTTVDVSASAASTLYPGGAGDTVIKISNPNPYAVRVTGVTGTGSASVDAAHSACTTAGLVFTDQNGLTIDVAAGSTTEVTLTGVVSMSTAATDACQGASFSIPVSVSGTQA